jgi:hypothetical protein
MNLLDTALANEIWIRYCWLRDCGHLEYVLKAKRCEDFFVGLQWSQEDLALLKQYRRPALTINKIISTLSTVMGEQIYNRNEIAFRPSNEKATNQVADTLTKVFMQISSNNQLPWVRSDVFSDGIITGRGFYDLRLDFSDSLRGELRVTQLNPKNVLVDSDADTYDPDGWNDVYITKWLPADQIELLYSKEAADLLRNRSDDYWAYGYDAIDLDRDRFGAPRSVSYGTGPMDASGVVRNIRVLERQYKKLDRCEHFADLKTGDLRLIPRDWDRNRISDYISKNNVDVIKKIIPRIRWTVVAGNVILHDEWSPYKHFTVVPYFPHFRRGRTVGIVENLLGPQELLNKVTSQELHVVNTTANSGWKLKKNSLVNMTVEELEARGAQTGLVLELADINDAEKIQPNQTPQGLDRLSYKAEEHIKGISTISDSLQGFDREDVAAKATQAKTARGAVNLAKIMDNLQRTDYLLARNALDCVQEYYTEERIVTIVTDKLLGTTDQVVVNAMNDAGEIVNDLTLGEFEVVVSSQPERDTFEDTQFDQAVMLRKEVGVQIPDPVLIQASRLKDKADIIKQMTGDQDSPEAKAQAQLKQRAQIAEVTKVEAEAMQKQTDAKLKGAKAVKELQMAQNESQENSPVDPEIYKIDKEIELERYKIDKELELKREQMTMELELKEKQMKQDSLMKRAAEIHARKTSPQKPAVTH